MTPSAISAILGNDLVYLLARILLTTTFVVSGVMKLFNFRAAIAEVEALDVPMPALIAALTIFVQLAGSAMVISGGGLVWLGAGALGVFIGATILVAHPFWKTNQKNSAVNLAFATEHVSVIGGLILVSILANG